MAIAASKVALVLLAAGRSERFGASEKLSMPLSGLPLGLHVAQTLTGMDFARRIAVVGTGAPDYAAVGLECIMTDKPDAGMGYSLSRGIMALAGNPVEAALIVLADMPFVTKDHVARMLKAFTGQALASSWGVRPTPPALFPRDSFGALSELDGDYGARGMLQHARLVRGSELSLTDIDTLAEFARWSGVKTRI